MSPQLVSAPTDSSLCASLRRRYSGAYTPKETEPVDPKPDIDKKCHHHCTSAWETYKKCEARIEEKVRVCGSVGGRPPGFIWP